MKKVRARCFSLLLSMCMLITMLPTVAFAAEGNLPIGLSSLCEHHEEHTSDCYTDELICGHVTDSGEETASGSDASHRHTQECYKLDCQFVCEECAKDSGNQNTPAAKDELARTITGFVGFDGFAPLDTITVTEKTTVAAIGLPDTLAVTLDGEGGATAIPVTWECAENYENTEYETYDFAPLWDIDAYALADNLDVGTLPYITVNIAGMENPYAKTVTGTMSIDLRSGISLASDTSGTGWTWTASSATLTLNGYQGQGIILNCGYDETINLVLVGASSVTADGADGVYCKGNLNISGSGILTVTATGDGIFTDVFGTLRISGGTVTASSTSKSAFNKAPSELPASYTAKWSLSADGTVFTTASAFTWSADFKYVQIKTVEGSDDIQIPPAPILGVVTPATGNAPQRNIPATDQYTAIIEWYDPSGTFNGADFAPETIYRLQIVLNAKTGYTFAGLTAEDLKGFTVNGIVPFDRILYNDTKVVIQAAFPATGTAGGGSTAVSTAADLKTALEATTPATINVTADIAMDARIEIGADHTLNIADGVTVSTENQRLTIPEGKTLTVSGPGTLRVNNSSGTGVAVTGTLKLAAGSTLAVENSGDDSVGVELGNSVFAPDNTTLLHTPGVLESNGGSILLANSGAYSFAIGGSSDERNDRISLNGGSLTVQNTGNNSNGISGGDLSVSGCAVTVESGGNNMACGLSVKTASITDSTLILQNTAGTGLEAQKITVENSAVTVTNSTGCGIEIDYYLQEGVLNLKSSTLLLQNVSGEGLAFGDGDKLIVDGSTVTVANAGGGGLYIYDSRLLIGANYGKLTLAVGAKLTGAGNAFSDRGCIYKYGGSVTVEVENGPATDETLTAGDYIWDGTHFAKGGTPAADDAETPIITRQPQGATVNVGQSVTLSVEATVSDGGMLSYRWMGSSNSELGGSEVSDTATFTPSTATVGTMYYQCIVTNTNPDASGNKTAQLYSDQVAVTVQSGGSSGGSGGGGGGGSTGGDSDTTVTTPPSTTENPNPPTQATITVKPTVSGDTLNAAIGSNVVNDAISKAQTEAKKNGTTANGITVEIKVDTKNTQTENINTSLPKESVDALVKAGAREVRINSEIAHISLNLDTLKEIQKQLGADISVSAKKVDNSTLSAEAQKIVGDRPVYDFSITGKNGTKVTDFGAGKVSISIPYTLGANENAANVIAYYIDSTGKITEMPNSAYDPITQTLRFVTNHFSKFAIGYKTVTVNFTDITNHWAKDSIEFVVARGILAGIGDGKFAPNNAMTRGMFVTALGRLAEVDTKAYTKSSFSDVKADAYYMTYVEWASKNGIVNGIGGGLFAPVRSITREQMAVMIANYAKVIGFELPKVHAENTFADHAKISTWAKDAVKTVQMTGIISGKNGNIFDPQGTASRAEVSAVLKRFVELAISTDTAEGWAMNDSGSWMYYENGKAVTGTKNIGGTTYTFDQYGVTADVPKNRKYGTYTVQKGDSFWLIAYKHGCTMKELEMLNDKSRFSLIHPGEVLKVPEK